MDVELGIVEGFYGRPWSWDERAATIAFLAPHGYGFYLYAPKVDAYLRRRWQQDHPREMADALAGLAGRCAELGVRFGVGVSPFEVREFGAAERDALLQLGAAEEVPAADDDSNLHTAADHLGDLDQVA